MPKFGTFNTIRGFLGAGGHLSVGIGKAIGWTGQAVEGFIRRHLVGVSNEDHARIMDIADRGISAANILNSLPPDSIPLINPAPIVEDQYGDDPGGKRTHYGVIVAGEGDDPGKLIRLDAPDFYSRDDMAELLAVIISGWQSRSPESFGGKSDNAVTAEAIRMIYTARKY